MSRVSRSTCSNSVRVEEGPSSSRPRLETRGRAPLIDPAEPVGSPPWIGCLFAAVGGGAFAAVLLLAMAAS